MSICFYLNRDDFIFGTSIFMTIFNQSDLNLTQLCVISVTSIEDYFLSTFAIIIHTYSKYIHKK
jgi:hypothetical protein